MKTKAYKTIAICLFLSIWTLNGYAQKERKYIRKGNRNFEKAIIDSATVDTIKYQDAETYYRKALDKNPNNRDASYNLANALYRQKKYEEASKQYQAVNGIDCKDKHKKAEGYHNLGNSLLHSNKLEKAIEAYKNALRNNPKDLETKYNLAWAQDKLKQQQNQQQNQQQKNKDQKNKDQKNKNKDKDEQNKDQQNKQDKNKDKQQQNQKQEQQNQQQQEQKQGKEENKMSKEDAMRILQALQNDEKKVQDKVQKQKVKASKRKIEKDW